VRAPPRKCLGMCRRVTNKGESGFGIASDRGTASVEQYYGEPFKTAEGPLHGSVLSPCEDSGSRGWDPKVLLIRPSPFLSALIQRGDSCPPLPSVELIQKVSTKYISFFLNTHTHTHTHTHTSSQRKSSGSSTNEFGGGGA